MTRKNIPVTSSDTVFLVNPSWKYLRRICLNTSKSGSGIDEKVYDFPILIRLSADNFNFTQAKNSGEDIRFATLSGAPIPYEIEQWDTNVQYAAVWLKSISIRQ